MIIVKSRRLAIQGMEQIPDPGVIIKKTREKKKDDGGNRVGWKGLNQTYLIHATISRLKQEIQVGVKTEGLQMGIQRKGREISSHERGGSNLLYLVSPGVPG
jgi:hypothetical protein